MLYSILKRKEPYHDLAANYFDDHDRQPVEKRLVGRLPNLGYDLALQPSAQLS
jgi:transposase